MPMPTLFASHQKRTAAARFCQLKVKKANAAATWKSVTATIVDH